MSGNNLTTVFLAASNILSYQPTAFLLCLRACSNSAANIIDTFSLAAPLILGLELYTSKILFLRLI